MRRFWIFDLGFLIWESKSKRLLCLFLGASLSAFSFSAEAQQAKKIPRIGALMTGPPVTASPYVEAFRQGLQELGYIEGRNIVIEYHWAEGRAERFAELAADLVRGKVDLILAWGGTAHTVTKRATSTIPIVIVGAADPVGSGFVASLARPGGNITGLSNLARELNQKLLELLKEIVPGLSRVAVLRNSDNPVSLLQLRDAEDAGQLLSVKLQVLEVSDPAKLEGAFSAMKRERAEAFIVLADPLFLSERTRLADLAVKGRLPGAFNVRQYAEAGGLISYGASLADMFRRAAVFVDKILKGTKPADLPVEQPTKFELVINLKTAQQIGVTIPPSVLARADRVIR